MIHTQPCTCGVVLLCLRVMYVFPNLTIGVRLALPGSLRPQRLSKRRERQGVEFGFSFKLLTTIPSSFSIALRL